MAAGGHAAHSIHDVLSRHAAMFAESRPSDMALIA
jgi:hypothetical protein